MSTDKLPQNDAELKTALEALFEDWRKALVAKFGEDFRKKIEKKLEERRDKGLKEGVDKELKEIFEKKLKERLDKELKGRVDKEPKEKFGEWFEFVEDGAFPGYFNQKFKILFVGWEAYGCEGLCDPEICPCDYWNGYKEKKPSFKCEERKLMNYFLADEDANKEKGSKHPERPQVAQRAAKITYGIQNRIPEWQEIPEHPECPKDMSLAFMDVSKFVNNKGSGLSPYFRGYVDESLCKNKSGRNFIREEIELLNPDLIISWNLKAKLGVKRFKKILTGSPNDKSKADNSCGFLTDRAWVYKFDDGREIPLLDTWHFSLRSKKDPQRDIYDPVMRAVQKLIAEGKLKERKS